MKMSTGRTRAAVAILTIRRHHLPADPDMTVRGNFREPASYQGMRQLLDLPQRPTAVFAVNDLAAVGAIRAIEEAGLQVPRDISIIGFNDLSAAIGAARLLTTVRLPLHNMGKAAAAHLLAQITCDTVAREPVVIPVELVVRQSTGPAPA